MIKTIATIMLILLFPWVINEGGVIGFIVWLTIVYMTWRGHELQKS